jgi:ATP-binding cassette subfamily C protein
MKQTFFFVNLIFTRKLYFALFFLGLLIFALVELFGLSLLISYISYFGIDNKSNFIVLLIINSYIFNFLFSDVFFGFSFLLIIFYIFRAVYSYMFLWGQQYLIRNSQVRFSKEIFFNFIKGDLKYTHKFKTNEIINNITYLGNEVFNTYFISYFNLLSEVVVLGIVFFVLIYLDPLLFIILLFFSLILGYVISSVVQKRLKHLGYKSLIAFNELSKILFFTVGLYKEVESLKILKNLENKFENQINIFLKSKFYSVLNSRVTIIIIELSIIFLSVLTLALLINKENTSELLAIYAISLVRIAPSLNRVMASLHEMKLRYSQFRQVIFDKYILASSSQNLIKSKFSFRKKIVFDNISYTINKKDILKNINFIIEKKDKVLIKGKSGAGKSTLFNIILGLYKISSGRILVDKNNVKNFLFLKNKKSIQTQENYLINDQSIYFNITFKEENDLRIIENDKKYMELIKLLNLEDFVNSREDKSNWKIGEFSRNVSGGERQRLCLARALYSDSDLLMMDEPFSSIQKKLANKILKYLMNSFPNKTILIVTHQDIPKKYFNKFLHV